MNHYNDTQRHALLDLARTSIRHGLDLGRPLEPPHPPHDAALLAPRASFVTLHHEGELRGCIGTLEAQRPLYLDVAHNAYAAAFRDPRFSPLLAPEYADLRLHIAILTPPVPLVTTDEAALLAALRPGVDGVILEEGRHRATFLPAVWAQLPSPEEFLLHLKYKAGLGAGYWSPDLRVSTYQTEAFGDEG